ncbi:hypothetical protein Tsubulata_040688 [Turnera subulata]|uniref:Uncharacterized protein n=1 Tax=Turnera subulata TaxID=218843 RepID=A0A9Q0JHI6_9ROSI|nr:hypothetical protein Tsubulata_040688 [Turnera subulata]
MEKDAMEEVLITTVFVYMSHDDHDGEVSHSLYAIEMPNPVTATPSHHEDHHHQQPIKCGKPLQFSLIHQFPASKYPFDMCCAKLGDRLYFLGGMLNITGDYLPELNLGHFPPTVCSFDPSTGEAKDAALPPMNSGKNWPLSFVADDNLYVLGSHIPRLVSTASPTYFEVFEPGRDRWTPLVPPPRVGYWDSCSIVGRKVLVLGHYAELLCFAFDLDTRKWAKIFEPRREVENLPLWTSSSPINEQGSSKKNAAAALFGVRSDGKLFINEGHTEVHNLLTSHSWKQISLVQGGAGPGVHPFFPKEYPHLSLSLCYLGNGCFCYLAMGSPILNFDAVESEDDEDDEDDQFILTVLFKDNILQRDHEEAQPSSASQAFQVECIHFAHEINLSLKNIWRIENSFAFRLTCKQLNRLTARAPEAVAGSLNNIATCDKGALERMSSDLSNQEREVQKKCEQKIKQETLEEMEALFRKRVANLQPDIRVQIAKELVQRNFWARSWGYLASLWLHLAYQSTQTPKEINILTARAAEAGAGSMNNIATCDTGALEKMGSNLSNQECEVQKKCEQEIKQETLEEMKAQFRKIVANVQPDVRAQIAKELAQQLRDRYAVLT